MIAAELVFIGFVLLAMLAWLWALRAAKLMVLAAWRYLTGRGAPAGPAARRRGVRGDGAPHA